MFDNGMWNYDAELHDALSPCVLKGSKLPALYLMIITDFNFTARSNYLISLITRSLFISQNSTKARLFREESAKGRKEKSKRN
ncbi:hypothetical protein E2C01_000581 [Portunus trituberculatus]|uniref:Uncharacterized protein n=1 Tax=Portunus trituberculatus TaxID=210409 RepID=A0A5B7CEH2_PORTR|nr:hypothetical protein [Portunus trituberculatus]